MSPQTSRALLLYQQKRYDQAASELHVAIASDPEDSYNHALLSLALANLGKVKDAEKEARDAIHLAPDEGFPHYCLAHVHYAAKKFGLAESAALEAIRLDTYSASYFATLGSIRLERSNWKGALEAATTGLGLQADNIECANIQSRALMKLGRREEAFRTVDSALSNEPDNARTHANKGWALLESGKHTAALEHFREALRLDPNSAWARQGLLSALKVRNPLYRVVFNYYVWMARLPGQSRYAFIIGLYVLARFVLPSVASAHPAAKPLVGVLVGLYIFFCFSTWTADPIMNAILRFDKFGKYALTKKQIAIANWVTLSLLVALASFLAWIFLRMDSLLVMGFGFLFVTYLIAISARASSRGAGVVAGVLLGTLSLVIIIVTVLFWH